MYWKNKYKKIVTAYSADLNAVCQPLLYAGFIDYFCYMQSYSDGSMLNLSSNPYWLDHYLDHEYYEISNFRNLPQAYGSEYVLCSSVQSPAIKIAKDAADFFAINDVITLVKKGETSCEFFQFGSSSKESSKTMGYYLNSIDFLKSFVFHFKDQFFPILIKMLTQKILIPPLKNIENVIAAAEFDQYKLLQKINRFYLNNGNYLTKKEVECLKWLIVGKSADEIAYIISCSRRTVEKHIEHMKHKLGCFKQSQLIVSAFSNGLGQFLLPR